MKTNKKVKASTPAKQDRFELVMYDEYNQQSIVDISSDLESLFDKATKIVTENNVDNALTASEKNDTWETYFPVFVKKGKLDKTRLYAGNKRDGKHYVYSQEENGWKLDLLKSDKDLRFLLGKISNNGKATEWFLTDHKSNEISNLSYSNLERKGVLFFKKI